MAKFLSPPGRRAGRAEVVAAVALACRPPAASSARRGAVGTLPGWGPTAARAAEGGGVQAKATGASSVSPPGRSAARGKVVAAVALACTPPAGVSACRGAVGALPGRGPTAARAAEGGGVQAKAMGASSGSPPGRLAGRAELVAAVALACRPPAACSACRGAVGALPGRGPTAARAAEGGGVQAKATGASSVSPPVRRAVRGKVVAELVRARRGRHCQTGRPRAPPAAGASLALSQGVRGEGETVEWGGSWRRK